MNAGAPKMRRTVMVLLIMVHATSCDRSPTTPNEVVPPPVTYPPQTPPPNPFAPVPGAIIYNRSPSNGAGIRARVLIFGNGKFARQEVNNGTNTAGGQYAEYTGTYVQSDSIIRFSFDTWFELTAVGVMRGDTLHVDYACDGDCVIESIMYVADGTYYLQR